MTTIYKILSPQEWEDFQTEGIFEGSAMDLKDGFIHCALETQYQRMRVKFFNDQSSVVLLDIDTQKLKTKALKIEANYEGVTEYPHIYGPIPLESVVHSKLLT